MAEFGSAVITDAGAQLLAEVMAGSHQVEFTTLAIGDGSYTAEERTTEALQAMTALKSPQQSFAFSSISTYSDTTVLLKAVISNEQVLTGFYINEIGIFARDASDASATPILYSIVTATTADYLPAYNGSTPSTIQQNWYATLSNTATAVIDTTSAAYALAEDLANLQEAVVYPELTLAVDLTGATVSAASTVTVTDGTSTFTKQISASGSLVFDLPDYGTWSVSMTNGTDTAAAITVNVDTCKQYSASIAYFAAALDVTVVNGTGATITATDGTHTFTAVESGGTAHLNIYAAGTYTISAELSGETGALTDSVVISTAGTTYTAKAGFASTTLNDNDWEVISAVSAAGLGDVLWDVGDCKAVALSGTVGTQSVSGTYYVFIIGFDHNSEIEGNGITFQGFKTAQTNGTDIALCDSYYNQYQKYDGTKYFQMNHWGDSSNNNTNYGGWPACDMRYDILGSTDQAPSPYGSVKTTGATGQNPTATCATSPKANTLMAALPAALRAVMKQMTKWTDGVGNSSNVQANLRETKDYLPLLAEFEIFGARSYANEFEQNKQKQYDYYKNGNSRIKYKHSETGTAVYWWERSAYYNNATYFCYVYTNGSANVSSASYSYGLAPAFLI